MVFVCFEERGVLGLRWGIGDRRLDVCFRPSMSHRLDRALMFSFRNRKQDDRQEPFEEAWKLTYQLKSFSSVVLAISVRVKL